MRGLSLELNYELLRVDLEWADDKVEMVGKNGTGPDRQTCVFDIAGEGRSDGTSLNAGEFNRRELERAFGGEALRWIVAAVSDGSSFVGLGCGSEAKEIPGADEIRP